MQTVPFEVHGNHVGLAYTRRDSANKGVAPKTQHHKPLQLTDAVRYGANQSSFAIWIVACMITKLAVIFNHPITTLYNHLIAAKQ